MKKIFVIIGITIVALAAIACGVIFSMGANFSRNIKENVEKKGSELLQTSVTLENANISLFTGKGELKNLKVSNPKGYTSEYMFYMNRLELQLGDITDDKICLKSVIVDSPEISFEGDIGKANLLQFQEELKKSSPSKQKLQIDYLKIQNAQVTVTMAILKGKKKIIPLEIIELKDIGKEDADIQKVMEQIISRISEAILSELKKEMEQKPPINELPKLPDNELPKLPDIKKPDIKIEKPEKPKLPFGNEK
ncbi:MAG: hypothetical protein AABZ60_07505 [Planctomycetota bacterium]